MLITFRLVVVVTPMVRLLMNMYDLVGTLRPLSARAKTLGLGPCTLILLSTMMMLNTLLYRLGGQGPF